jgi:hypothetical protein
MISAILAEVGYSMYRQLVDIWFSVKKSVLLLFERQPQYVVVFGLMCIEKFKILPSYVNLY